MEGNDRKRRKICPHCTENISYSAYLSHKVRYYDNHYFQWTLANNEALANEAEGDDDDSLLQVDSDDWNDEDSVEPVEPDSDSSTLDDPELEDYDYGHLEEVLTLHKCTVTH